MYRKKLKSKTMKKDISIVIGTWSWGVGAVGGDQIFGNYLTEKDLKPVFDMATKNGITAWDSAVVYGMGASETILGSFVKNCKREDIFISTKFTPHIAGDYENSVERMLLSSLERFSTDYIDMYWIHSPSDIERWTPHLIPLLKDGRVKQVGVSNHNLDQIRRVDEILSKEGERLSAVQNHYSLLYRASEKAGILEYCKQNDIDFWAYMVLEQGALSGKYDTTHPLPADSKRGVTYNPMLPQIEQILSVMKNIAAYHNATVAQIALAWAIFKGTVPIVGVTKTSQVDDLVKAKQLILTDDQVESLEQVAQQIGVDTKGSWEKPMI